VQEIAAAAERQKEARPATFERMLKVRTPRPDSLLRPSAAAKHSEHVVPYLSEPWYCCAEPTRDQLVSIGSVKPPTENALVTAEGFVVIRPQKLLLHDHAIQTIAALHREARLPDERF